MDKNWIKFSKFILNNYLIILIYSGYYLIKTTLGESGNFNLKSPPNAF
jgi:hypothetical protein